jgi:hypothetical protein
VCVCSRVMFESVAGKLLFVFALLGFFALAIFSLFTFLTVKTQDSTLNVLQDDILVQATEKAALVVQDAIINSEIVQKNSLKLGAAPYVEGLVDVNDPNAKTKNKLETKTFAVGARVLDKVSLEYYLVDQNGGFVRDETVIVDPEIPIYVISEKQFLVPAAYRNNPSLFDGPAFDVDSSLAFDENNQLGISTEGLQVNSYLYFDGNQLISKRPHLVLYSLSFVGELVEIVGPESYAITSFDVSSEIIPDIYGVAISMYVTTLASQRECTVSLYDGLTELIRIDVMGLELNTDKDFIFESQSIDFTSSRQIDVRINVPASSTMVMTHFGIGKN